MNKAKIKQLAELISSEGVVNNKIKNYVLTKLSRKDLLLLSFYLKRINANKTVYVESRSNIDGKSKLKIKELFKNKRVIFKQNDDLDSGIKVTIDDTIIDLSIKNYISEAVNLLKRTL